MKGSDPARTHGQFRNRTHGTHETYGSHEKPISQIRYPTYSTNLLSAICYLLFVITT